MISQKDRAKQFMPYDSLKGLQQALRKKEKEMEEKDEMKHQRVKIEDGDE